MRLALRLGASLLAGALCGGPVDAAMLLSAAPTGGGTAPSGPVPTITPGTTTVGAAQTCNPGTWTGTPTPTLAYAWDRNAVAISGATTSGYTIATADQGTTLTCVVTGTNTAGSSSQTSAGLVIPAGSAPTGTCSQSTAFFSRVWAAGQTLDGSVGGTPGPTNHQAAYDQLICANLVNATNSPWAQLQALYILATTNQTVASLNLVSSSFTLTPSATAPAFTANKGYNGVGASTNVYLDTHYVPSVNGGGNIGSGHLMVHILTGVIAVPGGGTAMGSDDGTQFTQLSPDASDGHTYAVINGTSAGSNNFTSPSPTGQYSAIQSGSAANNLYVYRNGTCIGNCPGGPAPSGFPTLSIYLLGAHTSTASEYGTASLMSAASIGTALSAPGTTQLYTAVCAYIAAVNGTC